MKTRRVIDIVVIGNDHYNTLNVVRALGRKGLRCGILILSDKTSCFVHKTRWMAAGNICTPENAITVLTDRYSSDGQTIPLIATDDFSASLVDLSHEMLKDFFILPSCGREQGKLTRYMDKEIQLDFAYGAGFDVPRTSSLHLDNWAGKIPETVTQPCIVKPEKSILGCKDDFRICRSDEELRCAIKGLKNHVSDVLVQEFIPNDEVILIGGVRGFNGDTYVFGEINKYKKGTKPHNLGLACMGVLIPDSPLRQYCTNLVEAMDYHGCFSIEILRPKGHTSCSLWKNYFVEINLRTDGLYYFYTRAGINLPYIWYQCCRGETPVIKPSTRPIYGMNEFLYLREQPSLTMARDILKANVFSTFDIHDIKPFIYKILYNVKKQIPHTP